ncbi:MAG: methyltransferase [Paludibacter sp.]|nr:methyltransferase [Bacteroidales bacterium]MCM1069043.1 methyltransferase [Prevotella sp.]MCM1354700.1 methyltransferase [Bacteroides sp.]MCM1443534.1 methyltransferase [Muribaculum sp.]MCM1481599.1 methyltransferase [Paludibacter sp.]
MSFRFKQFYVEDSDCAMKVGTDGVLSGAWTPIPPTRPPYNVLDIGTGSGLIALMIAQRCPEAYITAIDIDADAIGQSKHNFANSRWSNRLTARHLSLQQLALTSERFDLIVSNPPYFKNSLKAPDPQRTLARHTDSLTYEQLLQGAKQLLTPQGCLSLILPASEEQNIVQMGAQEQLYPTHICRVRGRENKPFKRVMIHFANGIHPSAANIATLTLEEGTNQRTAAYRTLTQDFYL